MSWQVRFISKQWEHHSSHSGYHQLVRRLGSAVRPLDRSSLRRKLIPGRVAVWLAARSGVRSYSYEAFYDEWAAARDMLARRGKAVYHVLYGDESYRYLGCMMSSRQHRLVATYHQPPDFLAKHLRERRHLSRLDALIVVGTNQLPFFEGIVEHDSLFWVPHGVDTTVFHPASDVTSGDQDARLCLFVGMHKRDFGVLRKVCESLVEAKPKVQFVLVTSKEMSGPLTGLANVDVRHELSEQSLVRLYQQADLLVQPLEQCTANNAILEGMSCGLPLVVTDVGGVRDYVNDKCAACVPPRDALAMASTVLQILSKERLRRAMAAAARERALQFDWEVIADQMRRIYAGLWAKR